VFVARHALAMLKGRVVEPLPLRSLLLRFLDDRAVAAVARERPEQQPLLPPHRRNYQRDQRGMGDGRWPYYVAVRQQQQRVGGKRRHDIAVVGDDAVHGRAYAQHML